MTSPPASDQQAGSVRVSDAERDSVVSQLSEHFQAGRLTTEEFDERAGLALGARTRGDLTSLMTDLPGGAQALASPGVSPTPVGQPGSRAPYARRGLRSVWVLVAVIAVVSTVGALVGHGAGGHVPWGLIVIGLLLFRCCFRGAGRARR
jgi:DUF1707 SHOCT-like domain